MTEETVPSSKISSEGEVSMVVLPFQDEGGLLCRAEEQGGVFALECLDQVLSGGGQSRVHNEQGELGEFFPLQPVQVAQGLLQPCLLYTSRCV